jgi:replicative DNA helicase
VTANRPELVDAAAEAGFLGFLLLAGAPAYFAWPASALDFAEGQRRAVYLGIQALAERGEDVTPFTVHAEVLRQGYPLQRVVLDDYLAAAEAVPTGGVVLPRLHDLTARRALALLGPELTQTAYDFMRDPQDAFDGLLAQFTQRTRPGKRRDLAPTADALQAAFYQQLLDSGEDTTAISTGLTDVDAFLGPLPVGELTVVAARTSVGKSAYLDHIARRAAHSGRSVLYASAEMTAAQVLARQLAAETGIPLERFRCRTLTPEDWAHLDRLTLPPVRIFDVDSMTTADVRAQVAQCAVRATPVAVVLVDHLHHLRDPERGESPYVQLGRRVAALKDLAKAHQCVVIAAAQLNRQAATRRPTLADLRDSGEIEEYADVVVFLHRDEKTPTVCEVHIAKNRNGAPGRTQVYFDAPCLRFADLDHSDQRRTT